LEEKELIATRIAIRIQDRRSEAARKSWDIPTEFSPNRPLAIGVHGEFLLAVALKLEPAAIAIVDQQRGFPGACFLPVGDMRSAGA